MDERTDLAFITMTSVSAEGVYSNINEIIHSGLGIRLVYLVQFIVIYMKSLFLLRLLPAI